MTAGGQPRWVARAWALLAITSALYFLADAEADNDLWMHLFTGRYILASGGVPRHDPFSYTAAGLPWVDHEWLTQVAFALVFEWFGSPGLWLGKLGTALVTVGVIWVMVARRACGAWAGGATMVLVIATMARGYAVRPQLVTYLAFAVLLATLDGIGERPRRLAAAPVLATTAAAFAVWANAHGGFVAGLGVLVLFAAAPGPAAAWMPRALRFGLPLAGLLGAVLTPYGPRLLGYIAGELRAPHPLTEWQPLSLTTPASLPPLALLFGLTLTLPFARTMRHKPWWGVLVALLAVLALRHQRHTPLLAIAAAAPLAEQLDGALHWIARRSRFRLTTASRAVLVTALALVAAVQLGTLAANIRRARGGLVFDAAEYPVGAIRFLRERALGGNLALPLDWGGYALWHAAPQVKVSLDGRFATVYPTRVVQENFAFFGSAEPASPTALLDRYDTTLVLAPRGRPTALADRAGWARAYGDDTAELFVRRAGDDAGPESPTPRGWLPFP